MFEIKAMATYQTVWPSFPLTLPNYPLGIALQPGMIPVLSNLRTTELRRINNRLFALDSYIFDLVDTHKYLSLTGQKLLGWYHSLTIDDRKIIQDQGGLLLYLQGHPALDVSNHHVYVKCGCRIRRQSCAQPLVVSNQQKDLEWEMLQRDIRATLTPHSHQFICPCHQPVTQAPGHTRRWLSEDWLQWQQSPSSSSSRSSPSAVGMDQSVLSTISLDMELQRRLQRGGAPELTSHISMTQDHSAHVTADCAEVGKGKRSPSWSMENVDGGGECGDIMEPGQVSCSPGPEHESNSIMKDDLSILVCRASEGPDPFTSTNNEASSDISEGPTPPALDNKYNVPTCDIMVGTEPTPCVSTSTQSECLPTADKNMVTEVHMSDLDYLAKEFTKLSAAQKAQREKSVGCASTGGCDCVQRAEQAELRLLAVQYLMCRQQCRSKRLGANHPGLLQKLERDYKLMREKMLEGVPLDKLQPLCVDSGKILTKGASYIPAQIISNALGNPPFEEHVENQTEESNNQTGGAVTSVPQEKTPTHSVSKPEEKQTQLHVSESWYDAEENLEPGGAGGVSDTGPDRTAPSEESGCAETESSVLCITNLPSNMSESDVMKLCEKYQASEVILSLLTNGTRVAIVMLSGFQCAEAAARELNGFGVNGRTLHVKHINGRAAGGARASGPSLCQSTQETARPGLTEMDPGDRDRPLPLSSSTKSRTVVCISPQRSPPTCPRASTP